MDTSSWGRIKMSHMENISFLGLINSCAWLEKIVYLQKMKSNMTFRKPLSVPPTAWF